jgi:tetratricopeptide (TPR) repeat protein
MQLGMSDEDICCSVAAMTARLLGGEQLSSLFLPASRIQLLLKQGPYYVPWIVCNCVVLKELTGESSDVFSLVDDSIDNLDDLQSAGGASFLHDFHVYKMLLAYWRGDYATAGIHLRKAALATENYAFCLSVHRIYYGALVSFQVGGDEQIKAGKEMLDEMEMLADSSMTTFEHKRLLLRAEYNRSISEISGATEELYKASIKVAEDHGNIHEAAIAFELLGKYYNMYGSLEDAGDCYAKAILYFTQWGAVAVAKRIEKEQNLDTNWKADINLAATLKRPAMDDSK